MNINTRYIKISGKDEIEKSPEMGDDMSVVVEGEVVKIDYKNNQDNTVDVIYHLKPRSIVL
jgi:archaellum component FlaG (FlaF/FlaG flagellin family)